MSQPDDLEKRREQKRWGGDSNGGGDDRLRALEIQMARIEERVDNIKENMATKADISEAVTSIVRVLLGIISTAVIAIAIALIRTFTS